MDKTLRGSEGLYWSLSTLAKGRALPTGAPLHAGRCIHCPRETTPMYMPMPIRLLLFVPFLLPSGPLAADAAEAGKAGVGRVVLASGGKTQYTILVPLNAEPAQSFAAKELARY